MPSPPRFDLCRSPAPLHHPRTHGRKPSRVLWRMLICVLLALPMGAGGTGRALAQDAGCVAGGPETSAYVVRVCLTGPGNSAVLDGHVQVGATVEVVRGVPPPVKFVQFFFTKRSLGASAGVLRDFIDPYAFTLPTERWADGTYRLEVDVMFDDAYTTPKAGTEVTTQNGVSRLPISTGRWNPVQIGGAGPVVLAAVGDGAGALPGTFAVADVIEEWNPGMLLYLGDVYNAGSYAEFLNYYEPTLGRMKAITNPIAGDHEGGRQFQGFLDYWDTSQRYYAVTAGAWRLFAVDSNERFG